VRELQATGEQIEAGELVQRILDVAMDQRMGVLLTSEIRVRALRDERLAKAYLAWQAGMVERIGAVISDLSRTYGFRLRLPQAEFSQLVLQTWEDTATNAVIAGLDFEAMCAVVNDRTVRLTTALIDPV
jgi:hypothetical protein